MNLVSFLKKYTKELIAGIFVIIAAFFGRDIIIINPQTKEQITPIITNNTSSKIINTESYCIKNSKISSLEGQLMQSQTILLGNLKSGQYGYIEPDVLIKNFKDNSLSVSELSIGNVKGFSVPVLRQDMDYYLFGYIENKEQYKTDYIKNNELSIILTQDRFSLKDYKRVYMKISNIKDMKLLHIKSFIGLNNRYDLNIITSERLSSFYGQDDCSDWRF